MLSRLLGRAGSAAGVSALNPGESVGDRHFPGAAPHSLCPVPPGNSAVVLRFAEMDVDVRSVEPDFDLCLTLSPVREFALPLLPLWALFLVKTTATGIVSYCIPSFPDTPVQGLTRVAFFAT